MGALRLPRRTPPIGVDEFLAETLGIAKRSVRIVSGLASRRKVLEIEGVTDAQIAAKINLPLDLNPTWS
jgi:uncharacterized protein YggU (UPF0235/DUF167 family)